jgi:hypothetical protein
VNRTAVRLSHGSTCAGREFHTEVTTGFALAIAQGSTDTRGWVAHLTKSDGGGARTEIAGYCSPGSAVTAH